MSNTNGIGIMASITSLQFISNTITMTIISGNFLTITCLPSSVIQHWSIIPSLDSMVKNLPEVFVGMGFNNRSRRY